MDNKEANFWPNLQVSRSGALEFAKGFICDALMLAEVKERVALSR
jgi:hypothetical protein